MPTLSIRCQGAATQELDSLTVLQGGLKKLSKKNLERLKKRITESGFCAPFFIWDHDGRLMIIDGTQRRSALLSLRDDGWEIPPLPVVYIHADTEEQARTILLSVSSQYGEWVEEELAEWLAGVDEEIRESLRLVDGELSTNVEERTNDHGLQKLTFLLEAEQYEYIKDMVKQEKEESGHKRYGDALFALLSADRE